MRTVALVTLALAASSCTLNTDYFSEYRGKNLLSNYGFESVESDGTTAKWALEEPDSTLTSSGVTSANFMSWTKASADTNLGVSDQVGPDGTSPAYRLEIKNLIPNGDFTGVTALASPWSSTGGTVDFGTSFTDPASTPTYTNQTMTDQALRWVASVPGQTLSLDFKAAVGGTWPMLATYRFRIDYLNLIQASMNFRYYAGTDSTNWSPSASATTYLTLWSLSQEFVVTSTDIGFARTFQTGDGSNQPALLLDNARLVPEDVNTLWVKTSLPLLSSGSATLQPGSKAGMYVFTVAVKDDPTAGTSNGLNRFNPSAVTVKLVANVKSGTGSSITVFDRPSTGWPTWTTLTVNAGFDFVTADSATKPALTVEIAPTDRQTAAGADAGSVLVAQPSLTFNP